MRGKIVKRFKKNGRRYRIYEHLTWNYKQNMYYVSSYILYKVIIRCNKDVEVFEESGATIEKCLFYFEQEQEQARAKREATKARQAEQARQARQAEQAKRKKAQDYYLNSANYYMSDIMDTYNNTINDYIF